LHEQRAEHWGNLIHLLTKDSDEKLKEDKIKSLGFSKRKKFSAVILGA
jgi:hypothetical protein